MKDTDDGMRCSRAVSSWLLFRKSAKKSTQVSHPQKQIQNIQLQEQNMLRTTTMW